MATATADKPKRTSHGTGTPSIMKNFSGKSGDISKAINASFKYLNVPNPKSDDEIAERINNYFRDCAENDELPLVETLALAIGVTRTTLWEWENGGKGSNAVRANMVKKAKEILASIDASLVSHGKIPQVTYIFRAKNFFGMKDQAEVVLSTNNPLDAEGNASQIEQKYIEEKYGKQIEQKETVQNIAESAEMPLKDVLGD